MDFQRRKTLISLKEYFTVKWTYGFKTSNSHCCCGFLKTSHRMKWRPIESILRRSIESILIIKKYFLTIETDIKYFFCWEITLYPDFQRSTVTLKLIILLVILIKTVRESRSSIHNASFCTCNVKIGRLCSSQLMFEFIWKMSFRLIGSKRTRF